VQHFCIYVEDITVEFIQDVKTHSILFEAHLRRWRLWLSESDPVAVMFYLRWSSVLHNIDHEQDHALGR